VLELSGAHPEESLITSEASEVKRIEVFEGEGAATNVIESEGQLCAHWLCMEDRNDVLDLSSE
jgi:hypothetical protein